MKSRNKSIIAVSLILLFVLVCNVLPLGLIGTAVAAGSDNGKVIVHFYNDDGQYEYDSWGGKENVSWGAYYWIDVGKVVPTDGKDPDFSKDDNVGQTYTINLNEMETSAVRSGKKLGLIMVRSYIDETNTYTPYWNGNTGKDLSSDRMLDVTLDANNTYEVWIIAGDKNNYTSLEQAKTAFESIRSAKFDDFNNVLVQSTSPVTEETTYQIYAVTDKIADEQGTLVAEGKVAEVLTGEGLSSRLQVNIDEFNWNADYMLHMEGYAFPVAIDKTRLYLSNEFKDDCVPTDSDGDGLVDVELGSFYTETQTTFCLWAPISTNVLINFYVTGDETDDTLYSSAVPMTLTSKGVWEATVKGDLDGVYYTYTNYVAGSINETCDPYATAVGINGNSAMVCDLDATDPEGWENDLELARDIRLNNSVVPVIWEIHVRDFSISADSGLTYKGKYLAFTEQDTTAKGSDTIKTGISYLKELGVTYVHLNPVYDFATVDEEYNNNIDYITKQNWGYDPKNYNVPEGSYATNAEDGEVRINEFKQMVQALHEAGIGVIMDVVYNHTFTSDGWFDKTVPGYYYRQALTGEEGSFGMQSWSTNNLGIYNLSDGAGCSNETASERDMYRSYMINSVVYWAQEYHIDGFRFDLMGCHDTETMNMIRQALNTKVEGGEGVLMYGEPWAAATVGLDPAYGLSVANMSNVHLLNDGIKVFNDTVRNALKGDNSPGIGFINGSSDSGVYNNLLIGMQGGSHWGQLTSDKSIIYSTSHDNYTLWDHLVATTVANPTPTMFSEGNSLVMRRNMMTAAITLMGKGTSFILAGEEIARTKYGNHNSYNAQDKINQFDYYRQEEFASLFNWYKGLIELRTQRFTTICRGDAVMASGIYNFSDGYYMSGANSQTLVFCTERLNEGDQYSKVMVICNAGATASSIDFSDEWTLIGNSKDGTFNFDSTVKVGNGTVVVPSYTTFILVQY